MAATTLAQRRRAVDQMLANWRIEGFQPDAQYLALLDRYISGELTLEEIGKRVDAAFDISKKAAA